MESVCLSAPLTTALWKLEVGSVGSSLVMCTSYSHIVETGGGFSLIPLIITRWEAAWLCAPHTTMLWKPDVSSVGISLLKCTSYNRTVETGGGFSGKQHGYVHLLQPHCGNWRWVQWEATWLCAPLIVTLWKLEVGSVGSNLVMCTPYSFHCITTPLQFMSFFSQY